MKVVLREDLEKIGNKGDVVTVKGGFARNYLFPRGVALKATKGAIEQAEAMKRNRVAREAKTKAAAEELAAKFVGKTIVLKARAGEDGKLFGSVGVADVATALSELAGETIDRKHVQLQYPIKEIGTSTVPVQLHAEVVAEVTVQVTAE